MAKKTTRDYLNHFQNHPLPSLICEKRTLQLVDVNKVASKALGLTRARWKKMTLGDILYERAIDLKKVKLPYGIDCRIHGKEIVQARLVFAPILTTGAQRIMVTMQLDNFSGRKIEESSRTDRADLRDLLQQTDFHLKETLGFAKMGSGVLNVKTLQITLSPQLLTILDVDASSPRVLHLDQFAEDFVVESDRARLYQAVNQGLQIDGSQRKEVSFEMLFKTFKGEIKLGLVQAVFRKDTAYGVLQDITDVRAQELVSKQQSLIMENMLSGISDGFFAVDAAWNFKLVNPLCATMAGKPATELIGKNLWKEFRGAISREIYARYYKVMGIKVSEHFEVQMDDDSEKYFDVHAYPNPDGLFVYFRDISKSKRAEAESGKKSKQMESILSSIQDNFVAIDRNWTISIVNNSFARLLGVSKEDLIGRSIWKALPEMAGTALETVFRKAMSTGEKATIDHPGLRSKSNFFHINLYPYPDGLLAIFEDIADRKRFESEIRRLALVAEYTRNAVIFTNTEGLITWTNRGFEVMTEYTAEEAMGRKPGDFLQGSETNPETVRYMRKCLKELSRFQVEIVNYTKSGRPYWVDIEVMPVTDDEGVVTGFISIQSDITRLKTAVQEMLKSQEQLQTLMDYSPADVFIKDLKGRYLFYNNSFRNHFVGESPGIVTDKTLFDQTIADESFASDEQVLQTGHPVILEQEVTVHGRQEHFLTVKFPMRNVHEEIYALGGVALQITDRKRIEKKLRENEERIRLLTDNLPTGAIYQQLSEEIDQVRYSYFSSGIEAITGLRAEEILTEPVKFNALIHNDDLAGYLLARKRCEQNLEDFDYEFRLLTSSGQLKWVRDRSRPQRIDGRLTLWDGFLIDQTDKKNIEERLRQSVKEKDMLIKEIHHRVKNNLQLISSIIYLKLISLEQSDIRSFLESTRQKIKSIALIHERLLQSEKLDEVEIADYLGKLLVDIQVSHYRQDLDLKINQRIEEGLMPLDTAIYCGLIVNELLTNSIKHAFSNQSEGVIEISLQKQNGSYILRVGDNGSTLPDDIVPGKASSFGMQMLDVFVKQLNGTMEIVRREGTKFFINF